MSTKGSKDGALALIMEQLVINVLSYPTSEDPHYIDEGTKKAFSGFNLFNEED